MSSINQKLHTKGQRNGLAAKSSEDRGALEDSRVVTSIYKPFFISGVLCVLTAGCLLGAIALVGISARGARAEAAWLPSILAHANAQLYGWVGLFVMGFALQQHAPRLSRIRLFYGLAYSSLGLILAAVLIRFAAEWLSASQVRMGFGLGVFASGLQALAVVLFLANTSLTRYRDGKALTWPTAFVFASLFWWLIAALSEPFVFAYSHQVQVLANVQFIGEWFPPYRAAQFLGFVPEMIFGVALVKLHECFGFKEPIKGFALAGFMIWNLGLLMRMVGWVLYFRSGFAVHERAIYYAGGAALASASILLVYASRVFEPTRVVLRSHKFIRSAFFWLLISGGLFLLEPLHLYLIHRPFSHAYSSAVEHAITVGVISQMIFGVAAHVVAMMNDFEVSHLSKFWSAFWLLNLGNGGRVFFLIASDYQKTLAPLAGMTGFIELLGLFIWAATVFVPVLRRRDYAPAS